MLLLVDEAMGLGLSNPGALAPFAALPIFAAGYLRYRISAGASGVNFQLKKLESVELQRALLLYKKVFDRLAELHKEAAAVEGTLLARLQQRKALRMKFADEREDLQRYAAHLRSAIVRLRGIPVRRFKSWRHSASAQFALGRSLLTYVAICGAGVIGLYCMEQRLLPDAVDVNFEILPLWDWISSPLLYANSVASALMLAAMPVLYLYRRTRLQLRHRAKLRSFKEFAAADPDRLIAHLRIEDEAAGQLDEYNDEPSQHTDGSAEMTCFTVLGISPAATIEEVKEAYKRHVKQNHPDRVQGMSPRFRELAEIQTKKLNVAYEEALLTLREREGMASHAMA